MNPSSSRESSDGERPSEAARAGVAEAAHAVAAMFPSCVVAAQLFGEADPALLLPEERLAVQHVAQKRLKDFTAGRLCARLALSRLGIGALPLLPAPDRQPQWPQGVTGSITHTDGYCVAVVARHACVRSLGIDSEVADAVREELWPRICCPAEIQWLAQQPPPLRSRLAGLLFAAKEAFYKCQYPLTGEWIGFEDVMIEIGEGGGFIVRPQRPIRLEAQLQSPLTGTARFHDRWVTAGIAVP